MLHLVSDVLKILKPIISCVSSHIQRIVLGSQINLIRFLRVMLSFHYVDNM